MTVVYVVEGAGSLIIEKVDGMIVIEAIAIADTDEPRSIVLARHNALEAAAKEIFGDRIELHDPLGLRTGTKSVMS